MQIITRQPYETLVADAWRNVFSYLNPVDLKAAAHTCALFYKVINKNSWRNHCHKVFTATLFPENMDWKHLALDYLFKMMKHGCFIIPYPDNALGIKLDLHSFSICPAPQKSDRINDLYLFVYPTNQFNPLETLKILTGNKLQNRFIRGATASPIYSTLIFFREDREKVLAAFFQAAKIMKLFHNPLRDLIIRAEAMGSKPSIGCSMAAEAAELRQVSCVTPPVP